VVPSGILGCCGNVGGIQQQEKMKLSPHFTLGEFTSNKHNIPNEPSPEVVERLRWLCVFILEPIRKVFGPIRVTSGYRCEELNSKVGGASNSYHRAVEDQAACDIQTPHAQLQDVFDWLQESGLRYDKVILERGKEERHEGDDCIHIQISSAPRREAWLGSTHGQGKYTRVDEQAMGLGLAEE